MEHGHIVIVGATSGSGRALVRVFSERQYSVSLLGRHPSPEVEQHRPGIHFFPTDLSNLSSTRAAIDQCVADFGKIRHVVFYQRYRGQGDDWEGQIQVSLTATKVIIELCAESFDGASENSIVVIGSIGGHLIHEEQPVSYHMVKAALNQMVRYYAVTLGSKGIRVNCVSPATAVKDESRQFYDENIELRELYNAITPLGRMGTSEDIANVVEFLCSQKASFITGQEIVVDGGLSLVGHTSLARRLANLDALKVTR